MRMIIFLLAVALAGLSCAPRPEPPKPDPPKPYQVVEGYIKALDNPDYMVAYSYYTEELKKVRPLPEYISIRRDKERNGGRIDKYHIEVESVAGDTAVFKVSLWFEKQEYGKWGEIILVKQNGEWKIASIRDLTSDKFFLVKPK